jgi:hypothetical protein
VIDRVEAASKECRLGNEKSRPEVVVGWRLFACCGAPVGPPVCGEVDLLSAQDIEKRNSLCEVRSRRIRPRPSVVCGRRNKTH